MIKGFSLIELLLALTLCLTVLSLVVVSMGQSVRLGKEITSRQNGLEALFYTVDRLKEDLVKCGMRFQELRSVWQVPVIENTAHSIALTYGNVSTYLRQTARAGEDWIMVRDHIGFKKNKMVVIYDPTFKSHEFYKIRNLKKGLVYLDGNLINSYPVNSVVILIRNITYRFFPKEQVLKRKVDSGYFQPLVEKVTDFHVSFFPANPAVLYRLEINKREQVQGYIFLPNMVMK